MRNWVGREQNALNQLRSRPSLADPLRLVDDRGVEVQRALAAARRDVTRLVAGETDRVGHLAARLSTLGPAATLARGYAVVQTVDPTGAGAAAVLRSTADAPDGTTLRIRLADGAIGAVSTGREDGAA
mgnify:FL=1